MRSATATTVQFGALGNRLNRPCLAVTLYPCILIFLSHNNSPEIVFFSYLDNDVSYFYPFLVMFTAKTARVLKQSLNRQQTPLESVIWRIMEIVEPEKQWKSSGNDTGYYLYKYLVTNKILKPFLCVVWSWKASLLTTIIYRYRMSSLLSSALRHDSIPFFSLRNETHPTLMDESHREHHCSLYWTHRHPYLVFFFLHTGAVWKCEFQRWENRVSV